MILKSFFITVQPKFKRNYFYLYFGCTISNEGVTTIVAKKKKKKEKNL